MSIFKSFCVVLAAASLSMWAAEDAQPKSESNPFHQLPLIRAGKVDSRWVHIGYGKFIVDDGAIRTSPAPDGLGLLVYSREKFGDCQFKIVFKQKESKSNSGFYVRLDDGILSQTNNPGAKYVRGADGKPSAESSKLMEASAEKEEGIWYGVHHGFEVQIAGGGADASHGTASIYSLAPTKAAKKEGGEWRTMLVTLDGAKIFVDLDGRRVTTFDSESNDFPPRKIWWEPKREHKRPTRGYIGLQTHDPDDIVWFKEISVRPIHRGNAKAEPGKPKRHSLQDE